MTEIEQKSETEISVKNYNQIDHRKLMKSLESYDQCFNTTGDTQFLSDKTTYTDIFQTQGDYQRKLIAKMTLEVLQKSKELADGDEVIADQYDFEYGATSQYRPAIGHEKYCKKSAIGIVDEYDRETDKKTKRRAKKKKSLATDGPFRSTF